MDTIRSSTDRTPPGRQLQTPTSSTDSTWRTAPVVREHRTAFDSPTQLAVYHCGWTAASDAGEEDE
ncbi:hypothetical protein [Haloferax sp. ATB1]|uniref:hypothetical protein n=1 Tax=Haloferax sp. ATB1 TaxID=1508454 RepID=UPI000FE148B4|nr:hypothetical protein [Haloferax sp. ATB1]